MTIRRKWLAVVLVLVLILSMAGTVSAEENEDAEDYIRQIVNYYQHYQNSAKTDMDCLIYGLSEIDLAQAQAWASIMDYWSYANNDMVLYPGVLPDGLPKDDSLCIVVLGYELKDSGSMKPELIGRLETALASAQKYPNALIVCTGGSTARSNRSITEAGQMAAWLTENGIDPERIIIEKQSRSTVGNAINTCKILTETYPQITHLALVTSDYHLPLSSLLFHAQATLSADDGMPQLCVAANASYDTKRAAFGFQTQLDTLCQLAGFSVYGMSRPERSKLDCILISGSAQCEVGVAPNLKVTAYYDTGLYRNVTSHATFSGFDPSVVGIQDLTVTYEEEGIEVSSTVQIEVLAPETALSTVPPTEPVTEAPAQPSSTEPSEKTDVSDAFSHWWVVPVSIIALLVIAEFFIIKRLAKIKKLQKAAKAAQEEEDIKLPDDDSPLGYV